MSKREKDVSVVITTYNYGDVTRDCIMSLQETENINNLNLIIVDDASTDNSLERLSKYFPNSKLHILQCGPVESLCKSWNVGIDYAINHLGSKHVCVMNNDILFTEKNWLTRLISTFSTSKYDPIGIVNPISFKSSHHHPLRAVGADNLREAEFSGQIGWTTEIPMAEYAIIDSKNLISFNNYKEGRWYGTAGYLHGLRADIYPSCLMYGGCFVITPSTIDTVGWFDTDYCFLMEESDYAIRCIEKGMSVLVNRSVSVTHRGGTKNQEGPYAMLIHKSRLLGKPIIRPEWVFITKHLPQKLDRLLDEVFIPYLKSKGIIVHPFSRYAMEETEVETNA